jgi:hypothetical protein
MAATVAAGALLALRRVDRFLLSGGAMALLAAFPVVALLQGAIQGAVRLDDKLVTMVFVALPIWAGVRGGAIEGFAIPVLGMGPVVAVALIFGHDTIGAGTDVAQAVAQGGIAALVLGAIGAVAGALRRWPGAPILGVALWPLFLLIVHFDALRGLSPWITVLGAAGVALMGWVLAEMLPAFAGQRSGGSNRTPAE